MQQIKCPKCGEVFQVDEAGYAAIVKQVRDSEFKKEVEKQEKALLDAKESAVKLAVSETETKKESEIAELRQQLAVLRSEREAEKQRLAAEAEVEKQRLEAERDAEKTRMKAEQEKLLAEKEREIERLSDKLEAEQKESETRITAALLEKENELMQLQNQLELEKKERALKEKSMQERHA